MKKALIILGIFATLAACKKDIEQSYTFRVSNSNAEDITVTFDLDTANVTGFHSDTTYAFTVPAGQTKDVFLHLQPDDKSEIQDIFPVPEPIYSQFSVVKSGSTANTDFLQQGVWTFEKENGYTGIYELVVDSTDF